jgi:Fic family protein
VLRYKEKHDIEARLNEVDHVLERWQSYEADAAPELRKLFRDRLMISLIYHDAALEGEVLSLGEIKAAIDQNIISDASLIPAYEATKNFFNACQDFFAAAPSKKKPLKLETVRGIFSQLVPGETGKDSTYRKENPLHRLYYHEISPPEKISYRMRKFGEWLESDECKDMHPVRRAASAHWRLMAIFPWTKQTGRVARIISNYLLLHARLPLAVIHSIDRQRYYEALKSDEEMLLLVYLEAVETTAASAIRVYQEAAQASGRRAS